MNSPKALRISVAFLYSLFVVRPGYASLGGLSLRLLHLQDSRLGRYRRFPRTVVYALALLVSGSALTSVGLAAEENASRLLSNWGQWRGPLATGEAPTAKPPIRWSEEKNLRWKVEIPGRGNASPIIWNDQVFVSTAIAPPAADSDFVVEPNEAVRFVVMALDRATGKVRWENTVREAVPHEGLHVHSTWASSSPVTDGEVLIVSFGSHGIYAFDLSGKKLWEVDLGDMTVRNAFGEGASPALHGETVVINWDHEGNSFIVALDRQTGKERWRQARDEPTSWATPLIVEASLGQGGAQVVVNGTHRIRAYDLESGKMLWSTGGMTVNAIPTPVSADGVAYVMSGFRGNALKAIDLGKAQGEFSEGEGIRWQFDRDTPYVPSPLLYRNTLYMLKHNKGILTAFDATTGNVLFGPERLESIDAVYASPVAANGHLYIAGRDGTMVVLKAGRELEVVATNKLDDGFDASPALVDGEILLRGRKHLYCIAED
ncbi:MAG: PQQ-binding-like beta-propeller repeat protein [Thermoanaerobaculia bacterium]|nr:PQQ-binding-like beta-propeller repeat protein [Thermoanaerobaculia bacterium]